MTRETERELVERLRGFEVDHTPDGWPAIQMKDVSALLDYVAALEAKQADVQMPEPVGIVTNSTPREPGWRTTFVPPAGTKLYTEQQVRQLLEDDGIQEQST